MTVQVVDFSTVSKNKLNPLGPDLRRFIWNSLDAAEIDPKITSLVLTGGSRSGNFSAGADLTEFSKLKEGTDKGDDHTPTLVDVITRIENFHKPIIAAVSGNALGGGMEIVLSCHYRIADKSGKFALPEVQVGVIPGAGGTQRLPRLIGVAPALDMILTGKTISTTKALEIGLVDHISYASNETVLDCAKKWALWAELMPLQDRRVGAQSTKESNVDIDKICQTAAKKLPAPEMGGEGVHAALEAVNACKLPIEEGMNIESTKFFEVLLGMQGKARRHVFFAVRQAQKPIGKLPRNHPLLSASKVATKAAVVGAGLMGSGIALVLLQAGFSVQLVDISKPSLDKGVAFMQSTINSYVKRGKISAKQGAKMLAALQPSQNLEDLSSCALVVEAVIENLAIKKKIFAQLDKITPPSAILLSNTSTLSIDAMAEALSESRRPFFAGWHFFSPAHVMKLVEIVKGKDTSSEAVAMLQLLTKRIRKTGVVVGNCDGFVGNRLLISYGAESTFLLEEGGATVEVVDDVFRKFGIALGPFQMSDLAGLDIGYNIRKERGWVRVGNQPGKNRPERYPDVGDDIVSELKRYGQKTMKGWYDYDPKIGKGRKSIPSKEVAEFVKHYVKNPNIAPYSETEIIERVLFPLVNEGFKCLEEGIAQQPSDIDVVYLFGYGWPVYRGGPMFWADNEVGLDRLLSKLQQFSKQFPTTDYFIPSKLLITCVKMNMTVQKYYSLGLHKNNPAISKL